MRARRVSLATFALLLGTRLAFSNAPTTKLVYERAPGAESCPDEAAMRADVAARLGRDPFSATGERTVVAKIRRDGATLRGTIELLDASGKTAGTRNLASTSTDCKELASAMALALALAIDPIAASSPSPSPSPNPSPSPSPSPNPTPSPPPIPTPTPPPTPPAPPSGPRIGLGAHAGIGFAPKPSWGLDIVVGWWTPRFSVDVEGRRDFAATADVGRGRATTSLRAVTVVPCVRPLTIVAACGVVSIGELQASGESLDVQRTDSSTWFALGARTALEIPVGMFAFGPNLELQVPLVRTSLRIDGESGWTTPHVAGTAGLRLFVAF